jgi:hypothetical protein
MDVQRTDRASHGKTSIFWTLITISGLPLLAYPSVLLANFMGLAAPEPKDPPSIVFRLPLYAFMLSTTLYPVVFFLCGAKGWDKAHWGTRKSTVFWSIAPLLYLVLIAALSVLFAAISGQ